MPSCLLLESIIQDPVYKGGNHHEDPMISFSLTSSRIDSIRASQHLVFSFIKSPTVWNALHYFLAFKALSSACSAAVKDFASFASLACNSFKRSFSFQVSSILSHHLSLCLTSVRIELSNGLDKCIANILPITKGNQKFGFIL